MKEKLFSVFGSNERMKKTITKDFIKPFFDEKHVSVDCPYLNTETVEYMLYPPVCEERVKQKEALYL